MTVLIPSFQRDQCDTRSQCVFSYMPITSFLTRAPATDSKNRLAQHDHLEAEQAHHLREPLQGCGKPAKSWNRRTDWFWLEGVLVAKKDFNAPKHEELDVPNLEVIKAMQSLTSKNFVKTQFSWQWYYYVLTPEGVEYLREWCVTMPPIPSRLLTFCDFPKPQAPPPRRDRPRYPQEGCPSSPPRPGPRGP